MAKRLYEKDYRLSEAGSSFYHRVEAFVDSLAEEATKKKIDLRDLQGLIHDAVDIPISKRILDFRRIKAGQPSIYIKKGDPNA